MLRVPLCSFFPPFVLRAISAAKSRVSARKSGAARGTKPFFTRYSLEAIGSNSLISHAKASRELGFHPRPARQAVADAVRWFQQAQAAGMPISDTMSKAAV